MKRLLLTGWALALLVSGCGRSGDLTAEGALQEKPGVLPPDRTALRVAQQNAPGGVSNEARLLLLVNELTQRQKTPSLSWDVAAEAPGYRVTAQLSAADRPTVNFAWMVDFRQPPANVCRPLNEETLSLAKLKVRLETQGLEPFLDGPTPQPSARG